MARTGAIVFRWGSPVRGREAQSLEVFGEALGYYEGLAKEGRIIGHREYFSSTNQGGFMLVEGVLAELHQLAQEDDFLRLQQKASNIVEDFTTDICMGGTDQTLQESMQMYSGVLEELDLI